MLTELSRFTAAYLLVAAAIFALILLTGLIGAILNSRR